MSEYTRNDNRALDQLRPITFQKGIAPHAAGSVLVEFGDTKVICAATVEKRVPGWMSQQGVTGGWISAEYSMLPYSTLDRKPRAASKGNVDGRTIEIQRLIGRALRAVIDLEKLPGHTIWVDCDVLQADGGTRTASITGCYVAIQLAINKLIEAKAITENPFKDSIAAVSVGIHEDQELLDLNYLEDKDASVDLNLVMTGSGQFVELQGTGEESTFSEEQLAKLLSLGKKGISELTQLQIKALN